MTALRRVRRVGSWGCRRLYGRLGLRLSGLPGVGCRRGQALAFAAPMPDVGRTCRGSCVDAPAALEFTSSPPHTTHLQRRRDKDRKRSSSGKKKRSKDSDKKKKKRSKDKDRGKATVKTLTHSEDFGKYGIIREVSGHLHSALSWIVCVGHTRDSPLACP